MAKMYSRGMQLEFGDRWPSPSRFAIKELMRIAAEMVMTMEMRMDDGVVVVGADPQIQKWAEEINIVVKALWSSSGLSGGGGFWDGVPPPAEDAEFGDPLATCTTYDGHDWRYVRESRDGMMRMFRCQVCGEEVVM